MDWQDIEKKLCERAEEVCRYLLPNGKRVGAEFVCGSVNGEEGDSLKVNLAGKAGVWRDFAGEKGGKTIISLWCSVRGKVFRECIVEAKGFLGIRDDFERRVRSYPVTGADPSSRGSSDAASRAGIGTEKPDESSWKGVGEVWARCNPVRPDGPVWKYLVGERRLEPEVLEWYGVREMVSSWGQWVMVFPYFVPHLRGGDEDVMAELEKPRNTQKGNETPISRIDTNPLRGGQADPSSLGSSDAVTSSARMVRAPSWLKFERLDRPNGKKVEWTSRGPEKCLFGHPVGEHHFFKEARHILICEGEKDALSWASYGCGHSAWGEGGVLPVSVPFGAKFRSATGSNAAGERPQGRPSPNREWLDRCWEWLQGYETVFVAMDSDEAGRRAAADIIREVGPRRCRLVELPRREAQQVVDG